LLHSCHDFTSPRKSEKPCFVMGEDATLALKRSILLRKRMRADVLNQCELAIDSHSMRASCIWFCGGMLEESGWYKCENILHLYLLPNIDRNRWLRQETLKRWRPQSSVSTSFVPIFVLPRQTCDTARCRDRNVFRWYQWYEVVRARRLDRWGWTLCWRVDRGRRRSCGCMLTMSRFTNFFQRTMAGCHEVQTRSLSLLLFVHRRLSRGPWTRAGTRSEWVRKVGDPFLASG